MIAPAIEELADDFEGQVKVGKVEVENNQRVATHYGIRSVPTLLFFKDGQVVDQVVGAVPKKGIAEKLNALLQTRVRQL